MKKGYGTTNILRRKGAQGGGLFGSLAYVVDATGVEVGTNNAYAAIHQFGGTVKREARDATFRYAAEGAATTKDGTRVGSTLRFAKADSAAETHKRAIPAYEITIPARPYLGIDEEDAREIVAIGEDWLAKAGGAR